MKPILVTGATGFLGWHIARLLVEKGCTVRALARPSSSALNLEGVERITGDLRDLASLGPACSGCSVVYHAAADYRLWAPRPEEIYQTNVEGTCNLLEAARRSGVERLVYTSTVGCIGIPRDGIGDEETSVTVEQMTGHYKRSKFLAEQEVIAAAGSGMPVVIVNPTGPVGDRDIKPTPTGKVIVDFLKQRMPAYVDTGLNLVDVRDAAAGHLLACERGRDGERYILGAENLTLAAIFNRLEAVSGIHGPSTRIPYAVAWAAGAISTAVARVTGGDPRAPLEGVRMSKKKMWVRHDKATRELGFAPGPVDAALGRAVEWFRTNGYV
jgi:dihydroflavonol-4-reductase